MAHPDGKQCRVCSCMIYVQLGLQTGWGQEWDNGQHDSLTDCVKALGEDVLVLREAKPA